MSDQRLEDYPEAVPMYRVAPGWRTAAIFLGFGACLAGLALIAAIIGLFRLRTELAMAPFGPPGAVPVNATTLDDEADPLEQVAGGDLPYPVKEDMRRPIERQPDGDKRQPTVRERFLNLGQETWKVASSQHVTTLAVSPDGVNLAYVNGSTLVLGPFAVPQALDLDQPPPVEQARRGMPAATTRAGSRPERQLVGVPTWLPGSKSVVVANAMGDLFLIDASNLTLHALPFRGQSPAAFPTDASRIAFVRTRPTARVDATGSDPREIVVGNLDNREERVVVPAGAAKWSYLSVSPDGQKLAAVSDLGSQDRSRQRVFLIDLKEGRPEALSPAAHLVGPVAWAPDSQSVVYARSQDPLPVDCRGEEDGVVRSPELFVYDLGKKQETRLSRGGGFSSPSVSTDGELYYLARRHDTATSRLRLRQVALASAWKFAAGEPEPPARGAVEWAVLLEKVCAESEVPLDSDGSKLTPDAVLRLDQTFRRLVREQFKAEVPETPTGLDRLRWELHELSLAKTAKGAESLVMGAVQGEHLRRQHGAIWHLSAGALRQPGKAANDFAVTANPFQAPHYLDDDDANALAWGQSLRSLLHRAQGRPLLLCNDPAAARKLMEARVSPELARGAELLQKGQAEEGEKALVALAEAEGNRDNLYLSVAIGKLLYAQGRLAMVRRLMEKQAAREVCDPAIYNLLGLTQLEAQPREAVNAFKKALRCDLRFGPAYLNLARAYEKSNEPVAARMCLRRCMNVLPGSPVASDALRRLGILDPAIP